MALEGSPVYHPVQLDREYLAQKAFGLYGKKYPGIIENYSEYQKKRTLEDFSYHISYIAESLAIDDPAIFIDYVAWAHVLLSSLHLPANCLPSSLEVLREVLQNELPPDLAEKTDEFIGKSLSFLETAPVTVPSCIGPDNPHRELAQSYLDALLGGDRKKALAMILSTIKNNVPVRDIYLYVFQPVQQEVGRLWQMQIATVAQEHYVTSATQFILAQMYMQMMTESRHVPRTGKTLVAACVSEELHEMGIRMVSDFFEMAGWNTYYIGANTPADGIISMIRDRSADLVALSTTMPYHLPIMDKLVRTIRASPKANHVKIIVGGYPFNIVPDLWKKIGADAYAGNADEAVMAASSLVSVPGQARHL